MRPSCWARSARRNCAPCRPRSWQQYFNGPAGYLGPVGLKPDATAAGRGLTVVVDKCSRRPQEHGLRRQQAGLPPAQRDAGPRFRLDADGRHPQRERGRRLSAKTGLRTASWWWARPSRWATSSSWATSTPSRMGARVLDANGKEVTPIMGSYGIGIERILTAAIEQSNDANGFWLPASIAPFTVVVTVTNVGRRGAARDRRASWPRSLKRQGSTCCSMTGTSARASNSKTRTWLAFPTASMWARKPPRARWNW